MKKLTDSMDGCLMAFIGKKEAMLVTEGQKCYLIIILSYLYVSVTVKIENKQVS